MDLEFLKFGLIAAELWLLAGAFLILLAGMFAPTKQNFPNILSIVFHLIAILWLLVYFPTTVIVLVVPSCSKVRSSNFIPLSSETTSPPTRIAISSSIAFLLSPKTRSLDSTAL